MTPAQLAEKVKLELQRATVASQPPGKERDKAIAAIDAKIKALGK